MENTFWAWGKKLHGHRYVRPVFCITASQHFKALWQAEKFEPWLRLLDIESRFLMFFGERNCKHVLYDSWPRILGSDISKPRDGLWAWSNVWLLCWSSNFPPEKRNCKFTSRYYWHINTHHALWGRKNGNFRVSEGKPGIDQPPFGSWWSWLMRKEARHPLFLKVLSSDNFFLKSLESLVFFFLVEPARSPPALLRKSWLNMSVGSQNLTPLLYPMVQKNSFDHIFAQTPKNIPSGYLT